MLGDKIPTGVPTPNAGALVSGRVVNAVPGAGTLVVPAGDYYMHSVGANIVTQVQDDAGGWNTVYAAGVGGLITSDGINVRWSNGAVGAANVTTQKV